MLHLRRPHAGYIKRYKRLLPRELAPQKQPRLLGPILQERCVRLRLEPAARAVYIRVGDGGVDVRSGGRLAARAAGAEGGGVVVVRRREDALAGGVVAWLYGEVGLGDLGCAEAGGEAGHDSLYRRRDRHWAQRPEPRTQTPPRILQKRAPGE